MFADRSAGGRSRSSTFEPPRCQLEECKDAFESRLQCVLSGRRDTSTGILARASVRTRTPIDSASALTRARGARPTRARANGKFISPLGDHNSC
eukprot:31499-Pelagococcus_subviridis.AAC.27